MKGQRMQGNKKCGKVYLVGAGPGDPELITMKGYRLLQSSDTIVYDSLVNPELLKIVSDSAHCISVGESRSKNRYSQDDINDLMIHEATAGNIVARLKGGDPFVFGRGSEEIIALNNAGIAWEIVPGISSGIAVPAYSGIPLTHRGISSSVAFVTGHECLGKSKSIDLVRIAECIDTIVIFMGLKNLNALAHRLLSFGKPASTPVAIIEKGTRDDQRTTITTLGKINNLKNSFISPALIVIGQVVNLREIILNADEKLWKYQEVSDEIFSGLS